MTTNFTFTGVIGSCRQPLWGWGTGKVVNKRFYGEAHPGGPYQNVHGTVKTGFYLTSGYCLRLDNSNFFRILLKVRELSEVDCSTNDNCGPTICKKIQAHEKTITNNAMFTKKIEHSKQHVGKNSLQTLPWRYLCTNYIKIIPILQ